MKKVFVYLIFCLGLLPGCQEEVEETQLGTRGIDSNTIWDGPPFASLQPINRDIRVHDYYCFIDSLVYAYDSLVPYPLTEHLIVRANPWIIDTLAGHDYYIWAKRDSFVYDQKEMIVVKKGDRLIIPSVRHAAAMIHDIEHTLIDVNIPEFTMRIYQHDTLKFTFPVRVGQYRNRYLETAGREVDLRTKPGGGEIIRIARDPWFINPCDGKRFTHTRRDDGRTTWMPLIPWIEPEIGGQRHGQLIHPTTNPKSLGKAYSNGCVGTKESDSWYIYYHAPLGTKVNFRYDLDILDKNGDSLHLKNIYDW